MGFSISGDAERKYKEDVLAAQVANNSDYPVSVEKLIQGAKEKRIPCRGQRNFLQTIPASERRTAQRPEGRRPAGLFFGQISDKQGCFRAIFGQIH